MESNLDGVRVLLWLTIRFMSMDIDIDMQYWSDNVHDNNDEDLPFDFDCSW